MSHDYKYMSQYMPAALIVNIFKYIVGINKKVIANLILDEEIVLWGNTMALSGVICHDRRQSDCGHYTSEVQIGFSLVIQQF